MQRKKAHSYKGVAEMQKRVIIINTNTKQT
jgi:hypothetical protein